VTGQAEPLDVPPRARAALAVFAHPDDETFGLGAVLSAFVDAGTAVEGLCFTRGEASTLRHRPDNLDQLGDLGAVRAAELADAAEVLGMDQCKLLTYPDGRLAETPVPALAARVFMAAQHQRPGLLVVFDEGGVTGHPDHQHATRAALAAAVHLDIGVLAWAVPQPVAITLNSELGTAFRGRPAAQVDFTIAVDRDRQRRAMACHRSQSTDNPVLRRRLELTGPTEALRWLRRPAPVRLPGM
jgi:N-acetylglucosamine malate deacetylase 2